MRRMRSPLGWFGTRCAVAAVLASANASAQQVDGSNLDPITGRPMPSVAPTPGPSSAEPSASLPLLRYGHRGQGFVRVTGTEGWGLAIRYDTGPRCGPTATTFCNARTPFILDVGAGYGLTESLELEARFRFGVENSFTDTLPLAAGLGLRGYTSDTSKFKFAFGFAALVDFTAGINTDILVRCDGGIHYDVARNFGFYVQLGLGFQMLRSLGMAVDVGLGLQARFP